MNVTKIILSRCQIFNIKCTKLNVSTPTPSSWIWEGNGQRVEEKWREKEGEMGRGKRRRDGSGKGKEGEGIRWRKGEFAPWRWGIDASDKDWLLVCTQHIYIYISYTLHTNNLTIKTIRSYTNTIYASISVFAADPLNISLWQFGEVWSRVPLTLTRVRSVTCRQHDKTV